MKRLTYFVKSGINNLKKNEHYGYTIVVELMFLIYINKVL